MLPFQNIHSGLNGGGTVCMRAEREGVMEEESSVLEISTWRGGSKEPPQYTKLALCEISGGHHEGLAALFSQSEPVCFL